MDLRVPFVAIAVSAVAAALAVSADADSKAADPLRGVASSLQQANARARVMLDRAYQVGSVRLPPPPSFTSLPFREHEVEQSRWLSAPGSAAEVVKTIIAHPPTGFVVTSTSRLARATDEAYYGETVELRLSGRGSSSLHILDVTAFPATAGRSRVLMQASVAWVPLGSGTSKGG
jgi:hypothetical protein